MHAHILGICGTFMAGAALLARARGWRVTGQDAGVYPPMSTQLADAGIEVIEGWSAADLPDADVFVIGNALSRGNEAVEAILDRGLAYSSGPQWLAENVLRERWVLAVAGTHGKTTTASLLAWILEDAGLAPGFLIGGIPGNFGLSARPGNGDFFVVEADEYDTAFFDKRSKFVHYRPRTLVLNNLEYDHADIFDDLDAIKRQFHQLVRTVPASGLIVHNAADDNLKAVLAQGCWTPLEAFGDEADWQVEALSPDGTSFRILHRGQVRAQTDWDMTGAHNLANALAAVLAARHVGVPPAQAAASLARFGGIKRRMELRGTVNGIRVYDDFAHHPTAIAATLAGVRAGGGPGRVIVVLEPRSNTMRRGEHRESLADSLKAADRVFVYRDGHIQWDLSAALQPLGDRVQVIGDIDSLVAAVVGLARPDDRVIVMSNGGFGGIHDKLLRAFESDSHSHKLPT